MIGARSAGSNTSALLVTYQCAMNTRISTTHLKGALRLHFRRRVFDAKTKVGEREDASIKNESPEAIESSRKTTFEFRRASADDVMRD